MPQPSPESSRPADAPATERPREPSLLEQALDETLAVAAGGADLNAPELAPLADVARRHRGRSFALEPVAVDLALAVLKRQFAGAGISDAALQTLARQVAQTLVEDPHARPWLEHFWTRLGEAVP